MRYKWVAYSHDWSYEDKSEKVFDTIKDCYDDMRRAVLTKMTWNTNYDEDFEYRDDEIAPLNWGDAISYQVWFEKRLIVHHSFSGTYVYLIVAEDCNPTYYDVFSEGMVAYLRGIEMLDFAGEETIKGYHRRREGLMATSYGHIRHNGTIVAK